MGGEKDLRQLLRSLQPLLHDAEYVFCTVKEPAWEDLTRLDPMATVAEAEGLTLVLQRSVAEAAGLRWDGEFARITLQVHSSLEAVGLTAAVATRLASLGISANVIAGRYHDHIFVPTDRAEDAMRALTAVS